MQTLQAVDEHGYAKSGSSSFGRASAFQAEGGGFEPRLPLMQKAPIRQGSFEELQQYLYNQSGFSYPG